MMWKLWKFRIKIENVVKTMKTLKKKVQSYVKSVENLVKNHWKWWLNGEKFTKGKTADNVARNFQSFVSNFENVPIKNV